MSVENEMNRTASDATGNDERMWPMGAVTRRTGIGEHIIRSGGASSIAFRYKSGMGIDDAVQEMLDEVARLGGDAGLIAVTRDGQIVMPYNSEGMKRACGSSRSDIVVRTFAD